jgi:hypothetical protein
LYHSVKEAVCAAIDGVIKAGVNGCYLLEKDEPVG